MRFFTNRAAKLIQDGTLDLSTDTIKVGLVVGSFTANNTSGQATLTAISPVTTSRLVAGMRVTGTGITAGTVISTVDSSTQVTLSAVTSGGTSGGTYVAHADPDLDTVSQISGVEMSGTGYTAGFAGAGRKTLGSKTFTEDDANNRSKFDAADSVWTALNAGIITGFWLMKEITNDAGSVLIYYCSDGGFPLTSNGGDFTIVWDAVGVATFDVQVD